jgi:hypothetical protein
MTLTVCCTLGGETIAAQRGNLHNLKRHFGKACAIPRKLAYSPKADAVRALLLAAVDTRYKEYILGWSALPRRGLQRPLPAPVPLLPVAPVPVPLPGESPRRQWLLR